MSRCELLSERGVQWELTADTALIVAAAVRGMQEIYRPDPNMGKPGVHLLDIKDGSIEQQEFDLDEPENEHSGLMLTLARLPRRYGKATVSIASAGNAGIRALLEANTTIRI